MFYGRLHLGYLFVLNIYKNFSGKQFGGFGKALFMHDYSNTVQTKCDAQITFL